MPTDPLLAAMYEVQVAKLRTEAAARKPDASGNLPPEPSDAEKAAEKQGGQFAAARIAGELFALPKNQRMAALIQMPVEDRIAFTSYVDGDQKNQLHGGLYAARARDLSRRWPPGVGAQYQIGQELAQAKMVRAILSERQLQEVMTDFWFNHFNIYIAKDSDQWYTTSYERDVIRKNALGKFGDLLLATAQSPAMLVYLDNWLSIGPDSLANGVNPANPRSKPGNKRAERELWPRDHGAAHGRRQRRLHAGRRDQSLGDPDWLDGQSAIPGGGGFQFDPKRHEPGTKVWLGHRIGSGPPFVIQGTLGHRSRRRRAQRRPR